MSLVFSLQHRNNIIICTKRERLIAQALWNTLNHLILSLLMYYYPIPVNNATTPLNLIVGSPSLLFTLLLLLVLVAQVLAVARGV